MSIYSKINIGQAASNYSKFDLSHKHLTTLDFNQLCPTMSIQTNIGDKFNINFNAFGRISPLVTPTMGIFGLRVVTAHVPLYTIADDADAYISGLKQHAGNISRGRLIRAYELAQGFFGEIFKNQVSNLTTSKYVRLCTDGEIERIQSIDTEDENIPRNFFIIKKEWSSTHFKTYLTFTAKGKVFYKILRSLGYDLPQIVSYKTMDLSDADGFDWADKRLNLYPLIAYFKVYADLFLPTAYYNTSNLLKILYSIKTADDVSGSVTSDGLLSFTTIDSLFTEVFNVFYDSDYFTTAWQSPNSPLSSYQVTTESPSVNEYGNSFGQTGTNNLSVNKTGNILIQHSTNNVTGFSQTQLDFLRAFDKFVRRNNLTGYREFNTVYSRFGIKPSEMKSQYCELLDVRNIQLNVGDVTSTAQTEGTDLGSYAGKGFLNGNTNIQFEARDFGYIIQIAHLYVKPIYYQGIRKDILKSSYLDFYQPEFDGVGPQPISKLELNSNYNDGVFGFTERYNDYRFQLSNITGDFALDPNMHSWHFGREFMDHSKDNVPVAQTLDFLSYGSDTLGNSEFDRIFTTQNVKNQFDHFFIDFDFQISALRKMKNISQAVDLGQGNISLDRNGSV